MSPRTALLVALVAAACLAPAVVRADDPWYLKLDVQLDDKTTGDIILRVEPDMAPLGAARLREIVDEGIWDNARFFRVINGFMVCCAEALLLWPLCHQVPEPVADRSLSRHTEHCRLPRPTGPVRHSRRALRGRRVARP